MSDRRIAGVASGLSDFFGIDATLIRVLFVLSTFFGGGAGALIYLICWLVLPAGPATPTPSPPQRGQHRGLAWVIVVCALILAGVNAIHDHRTIFIAVVVLVIAVFIWRKARTRTSWKAHRDFEKARLAWQRRIDEQASNANPPTTLGGDPFHIDSFYPPSPPDEEDPNNPSSGFQTQ